MTPEQKGTTVDRPFLGERNHPEAEDLQVPIFAPTWSTVRETHGMSLAQDAAETGEVDLLRDTALLRSVQWGLGFFLATGHKEVAECGLFRGSSGPLGSCQPP